MIFRLIIGFVSSAALALAASAASSPFWQILENVWCLISAEKRFCIADATMERSWRHGNNFKVANPDVGPPLVLSFTYFDPDNSREFDEVDESFELMTTEQFGTLVVRRYRVQLGDLPRSNAEFISITEPSDFSIAFVGGTKEMRSNFVDSFVAAWSD